MSNRDYEITAEYLKEKMEVFIETAEYEATETLWAVIAIYEVGLAMVERLDHPHK